jgi:drug/metabolite transporter (DMT)-like permease
MLLGVLMWGGNWVAAKVSVGVVPPLTLATLRYAVASPILLAWLARQGPLPRVAPRDRRTLVLLGVLFGVVSNVLFLYGLQYAPAVDGAIIYQGFQPAFAAVLAVLLLGETVRGRQAAGLAVALGGLVLVVGSGQLGAAGGSARLLGDLMYLVGALVWAYTNVLVRQLAPRLPVVAATTYSGLICLPILLAGSLAFENGWARLPAAIAAAWPALGYMTIISTGPPTIFFYNGIHRLGVARAAAFSYLVPVSGVALSVLMLGEQLLLPQVLGGLLVLAGLWLISRRSGAATPAPSRAAQRHA